MKRMRFFSHHFDIFLIVSTLQNASMHADEKRAARQREIVTCPRDNGINKAGLEGGRACSFHDRLSIVSF